MVMVVVERVVACRNLTTRDKLIQDVERFAWEPRNGKLDCILIATARHESVDQVAACWDKAYVN